MCVCSFAHDHTFTFQPFNRYFNPDQIQDPWTGMETLGYDGVSVWLFVFCVQDVQDTESTKGELYISQGTPAVIKEAFIFCVLLI